MTYERHREGFTVSTLLVTRDAHELYRPFGFTALASPDRHMEIARPGIYRRKG